MKLNNIKHNYVSLTQCLLKLIYVLFNTFLGVLYNNYRCTFVSGTGLEPSKKHSHKNHLLLILLYKPEVRVCQEKETPIFLHVILQINDFPLHLHFLPFPQQLWLTW